MSTDFLQWAIFFAILLALVFPMGSYMAKVFTGGHTWFDRVFNPIDNAHIQIERNRPKSATTLAGVREGDAHYQRNYVPGLVPPLGASDGATSQP